MKCSVILTVYWLIYATYIQVPFNSSVATVIIRMRNSLREFW